MASRGLGLVRQRSESASSLPLRLDSVPDRCVRSFDSAEADSLSQDELLLVRRASLILNATSSAEVPDSLRATASSILSGAQMLSSTSPERTISTESFRNPYLSQASRPQTPNTNDSVPYNVRRRGSAQSNIGDAALSINIPYKIYTPMASPIGTPQEPAPDHSYLAKCHALYANHLDKYLPKESGLKLKPLQSFLHACSRSKCFIIGMLFMCMLQATGTSQWAVRQFVRAAILNCPPPDQSNQDYPSNQDISNPISVNQYYPSNPNSEYPYPTSLNLLCGSPSPIPLDSADLWSFFLHSLPSLFLALVLSALANLLPSHFRGTVGAVVGGAQDFLIGASLVAYVSQLGAIFQSYSSYSTNLPSSLPPIRSGSTHPSPTGSTDTTQTHPHPDRATTTYPTSFQSKSIYDEAMGLAPVPLLLLVDVVTAHLLALLAYRAFLLSRPSDHVSDHLCLHWWLSHGTSEFAPTKAGPIAWAQTVLRSFESRCVGPAVSLGQGPAPDTPAPQCSPPPRSSPSLAPSPAASPAASAAASCLPARTISSPRSRGMSRQGSVVSMTTTTTTTSVPTTPNVRGLVLGSFEDASINARALVDKIELAAAAARGARPTPTPTPTPTPAPAPRRAMLGSRCASISDEVAQSTATAAVSDAPPCTLVTQGSNLGLLLAAHPGSNNSLQLDSLGSGVLSNSELLRSLIENLSLTVFKRLVALYSTVSSREDSLEALRQSKRTIQALCDALPTTASDRSYVGVVTVAAVVEAMTSLSLLLGACLSPIGLPQLSGPGQLGHVARTNENVAVVTSMAPHVLRAFCLWAAMTMCFAQLVGLAVYAYWTDWLPDSRPQTRVVIRCVEAAGVVTLQMATMYYWDLGALCAFGSLLLVHVSRVRRMAMELDSMGIGPGLESEFIGKYVEARRHLKFRDPWVALEAQQRQMSCSKSFAEV